MAEDLESTVEETGVTLTENLDEETIKAVVGTLPNPGEEFFDRVIPLPGKLKILGQEYDFFYDFTAMRDVERKYKSPAFKFVINEDEYEVDDILFFLMIGLQGGVRRRIRLANGTLAEMQAVPNEITEAYAEKLLEDSAEDAGGMLPALGGLWTAIKLVWTFGRKVPVMLDPDKKEGKEENPQKEVT